MKIKSLNLTSANALDIDVAFSSPVCVFHGHYSDLALDLIRELIGDYGAKESPDRIDGRFVIHSDVEMDNKRYSVCYMRNADCMGDNRIAVNFAPNSCIFSIDDTQEYELKRGERNASTQNVFDEIEHSKDSLLSECDRRLRAFENFLDNLDITDDRPIFIYGLFDRIDESVDFDKYLERLSSLGRQVFISVCGGFQVKRLSHKSVQAISTVAFDNLSVGAKYNEDFTVIICPICGNKTLDFQYICPNCNWEYDGFPEDHYSAANGATLKEYRARYEKQTKSHREN